MSMCQPKPKGMADLYTLSRGTSFLHRLDPRTKLACAVCVLLFSFMVSKTWLLFLGLVVLTWMLGRIGPRHYYPLLLWFLPLMSAITLWHTLFMHGPPYYVGWQLGPFAMGLSHEGLRVGVTIAFRLASMGLAFMIFAMTTEPYQWGLAMYKIGLPYKVAHMFATAIRFLPLLTRDLHEIQDALRARGSRLGLPYRPVAFYRGMVTLLIPMVLSSIQRSQATALAMELRGLSLPEQTGVKRVLYREVSMALRDYLTVFLTVGGLAALVAFSVLS